MKPLNNYDFQLRDETTVTELGDCLAAPPSLVLKFENLNYMKEIRELIFFQFQLLRKENLDLKLTPYKVLATSSKQGMC